MSSDKSLWKFAIGFVGGLTPYLLGFATLCWTIGEYKSFPPWRTAVLRIVAVIIFSIVGGLASTFWGAKEKDMKRLFLIGMGAPAIFASGLNNLQAGLNRPAPASANAEVSTLSPGSPTMPYVRPYFAVIGARMTSDGEPSVMLPAANFADEKNSAVDFLSEVFRAIGVSGADSRTVFPLTFLALAMLAYGAYGAWVSIQRRKALALLTVRLAMIEPGIQSDRATTSKPRPEPEGSAALLNKGDSLEKGLGALVEGRLEPAFELFTQAISEVADAFNYRAQASFYLGRYESALRDLSTFLELRPHDAAGLVNKGATLGALNRSEEEIAVYGEVVSRFGTAAEPALRKVADTASEQIRTIAARTH